jgi:hypothetical protein
MYRSDSEAFDWDFISTLYYYWNLNSFLLLQFFAWLYCIFVGPTPS